MHRQLFLILGLVAFTYSANVIKASNDEALKGLMDKARGGLDKLLDTAESAAATTREKTLTNLQGLRKQYSDNHSKVKAQLVAATEKLKDSLSTNYKLILGTLERNNANIRDQIEPNFNRGVESFKTSFESLAAKLPSLNAHLEATLFDLNERSKSVFAKNDEEHENLKKALEEEYQGAVNDLSS